MSGRISLRLKHAPSSRINCVRRRTFVARRVVHLSARARRQLQQEQQGRGDNRQQQRRPHVCRSPARRRAANSQLSFLSSGAGA